MLQKIEHYISALAQLEQAVAIYQKSQQDALYRDGLIQRRRGMEQDHHSPQHHLPRLR